MSKRNALAYASCTNPVHLWKRPLPWLLDREGRASKDPLVAKEKGAWGRSANRSENSSYKGYGLAVMVNILAS